MADIQHADAPLGEIHTVANWRVADASARLALAPGADDDLKVAFQEDDSSFWAWDQDGGAWAQINGASGGAVNSVNGQTGVVVLDADDVGAVPTARTITAGTGLSGGGDLTADRTLTVSYGSSAGTAAQGNDSRLSDARTPTTHAASHAAAGSDPVTLSQSQITDLTSDLSGKQAADATLTALAGVTTSADTLIYATGADAFTTTSFTAAGRAILDDADASAQRTTLGLGTLATQSGTFSGTSSGTNTGDQTSVTGNAGTATALATARNIDGQSFNGTADITVIAPGTVAATGKTTPVDADVMPLADSAASNVLKKVTWANVKATLKTYFDTLYTFVNPMTTSQDIIVGGVSGAPGRLGKGADGTFLGVVAGSLTYTTPSGSGDVVGPASSVDNRVAFFSGTTGKLLKDSGLTLSGSNTGDQTTVTGNAGTATALQNARTIDGQSFDGTANITVIAPGTVAATAKTTPVDADVMPLADSAASNVLKKVTWANIKATLKTYLDTLYITGPGTVTSGRTVVFSGTTGLAVTQSSRLEADLVAGPASSTSGRVATFNGTGGKTIQDGGTLLSALATLASPALTGTPTAPTAATTTSTTQVATTAFVQQEKVITQNSQSTAYTAVLTDANKHLLHPAADTTARTFTIPANSSVAYPIGTTLTFVNQNAAGVMTIAITTDTMRLAGAGTTGSRTLAANGIATALKITSTEWIINGTGLT